MPLPKKETAIMKRINTVPQLTSEKRKDQTKGPFKTVRGRIVGWEARGRLTVLTALVAGLMMLPAVAHAQLGYLLVSDYDGTTGAFMDEFVPQNSGGLARPFALVFGVTIQDSRAVCWRCGHEGIA